MQGSSDLPKPLLDDGLNWLFESQSGGGAPPAQATISDGVKAGGLSIFDDLLLESSVPAAKTADPMSVPVQTTVIKTSRKPAVHGTAFNSVLVHACYRKLHGKLSQVLTLSMERPDYDSFLRVLKEFFPSIIISYVWKIFFPRWEFANNNSSFSKHPFSKAVLDLFKRRGFFTREFIDFVCKEVVGDALVGPATSLTRFAAAFCSGVSVDGWIDESGTQGELSRAWLRNRLEVLLSDELVYNPLQSFQACLRGVSLKPVLLDNFYFSSSSTLRWFSFLEFEEIMSSSFSSRDVSDLWCLLLRIHCDDESLEFIPSSSSPFLIRKLPFSVVRTWSDLALPGQLFAWGEGGGGGGKSIGGLLSGATNTAAVAEDERIKKVIFDRFISFRGSASGILSNIDLRNFLAELEKFFSVMLRILSLQEDSKDFVGYSIPQRWEHCFARLSTTGLPPKSKDKDFSLFYSSALKDEEEDEVLLKISKNWIDFRDFIEFQGGVLTSEQIEGFCKSQLIDIDKVVREEDKTSLVEFLRNPPLDKRNIFFTDALGFDYSSAEKRLLRIYCTGDQWVDEFETSEVDGTGANPDNQDKSAMRLLMADTVESLLFSVAPPPLPPLPSPLPLSQPVAPSDGPTDLLTGGGEEAEGGAVASSTATIVVPAEVESKNERREQAQIVSEEETLEGTTVLLRMLRRHLFLSPIETYTLNDLGTLNPTVSAEQFRSCLINKHFYPNDSYFASEKARRKFNALVALLSAPQVGRVSVEKWSAAIRFGLIDIFLKDKNVTVRKEGRIFKSDDGSWPETSETNLMVLLDVSQEIAAELVSRIESFAGILRMQVRDLFWEKVLERNSLAKSGVDQRLTSLLDRMFDSFDKDKSGIIELEELRLLMICLRYRGPIGDAELRLNWIKGGGGIDENGLGRAKFRKVLFHLVLFRADWRENPSFPDEEEGEFDLKIRQASDEGSKKTGKDESIVLLESLKFFLQPSLLSLSYSEDLEVVERFLQEFGNSYSYATIKSFLIDIIRLSPLDGIAAKFVFSRDIEADVFRYCEALARCSTRTNSPLSYVSDKNTQSCLLLHSVNGPPLPPLVLSSSHSFFHSHPKLTKPERVEMLNRCILLKLKEVSSLFPPLGRGNMVQKNVIVRIGFIDTFKKRYLGKVLEVFAEKREEDDDRDHGFWNFHENDSEFICLLPKKSKDELAPQVLALSIDFLCDIQMGEDVRRVSCGSMLFGPEELLRLQNSSRDRNLPIAVPAREGRLKQHQTNIRSSAEASNQGGSGGGAGNSTGKNLAIYQGQQGKKEKLKTKKKSNKSLVSAMLSFVGFGFFNPSISSEPFLTCRFSRPTSSILFAASLLPDDDFIVTVSPFIPLVNRVRLRASLRVSKHDPIHYLLPDQLGYVLDHPSARLHFHACLKELNVRRSMHKLSVALLVSICTRATLLDSKVFIEFKKISTDPSPPSNTHQSTQEPQQGNETNKSDQVKIEQDGNPVEERKVNAAVPTTSIPPAIEDGRAVGEIKKEEDIIEWLFSHGFFEMDTFLLPVHHHTLRSIRDFAL